MAEPAEDTKDDAVEDQTSGKLDDVLADARAFMVLCKEADNDNRKNGLDDLKFLAGDQWDAIDARQRTIDQRPMLTINKLPAFLHQVTNSLRQNRPSIKVHPVSGGADIDTAKVRQGMIRHMEYASNADVAYDTAACSAAGIGYGYFRIITEYSKPDAFTQDIRFLRIRNPFTVFFDPMSIEPDGSDQRKCLIISKMTRADFQRQWPDAEANNTALAIGDNDIATNWMFTDEVTVAEYYRVEETPCKVHLMQDGTTMWDDEIPADSKDLIKPLIVDSRDSFKRKVMLRKVTGTDILEETEIMCYWIPVLRVCGDEIDLDGKVYRSGLIRHAKDPARMYNYWMTSATEEIALRPKTPYIGAEGQFEGYESDWKQANVKSFPFLQYVPVTLEGNLAPAPQRQPMADIPSGMLAMAMHANDNIKATTGLFDSSLGARGNATSGKQELAQQRQGDTSNFHFADGLNMAVRQAGRCINWMIPHYYDTQRVVQIMSEDDVVSHETINQQVPLHAQQPDPLSGAIKTVLNDMTGGEFAVTVSAGPSYQTLRQEAAESMLDMTHNNPQLMGIAGDLIVSEMDWPGADKIAARIKKSLPPQLTAGEDNADAQTAEMKLAQAAQAMNVVDQKSQEIDQHIKDLQKFEHQLKQEGLKVQGEQMQVESEKMAIDAERQVMKAEFAKMQAELRLAQNMQQTAGEEVTDPEQSIEWKKALLDADVKIAVAEINASTTKSTAAMSANAKGDGTTTTNADGTSQPSSGLTSLIDAINSNMQGLVQGQQMLAEHLAKPKTRSAKAVRQPDGSFVMQSIEQ